MTKYNNGISGKSNLIWVYRGYALGLWVLGAVFGFIFFSSNKPKNYPPIPSPVGRPDRVSSYYRSDGTYVHEYNRAPPGEKDEYDLIDSERSAEWLREMDALTAQKNKVELQAWLIFLESVLVGGFILLRRHCALEGAARTTVRTNNNGKSLDLSLGTLLRLFLASPKSRSKVLGYLALWCIGCSLFMWLGAGTVAAGISCCKENSITIEGRYEAIVLVISFLLCFAMFQQYIMDKIREGLKRPSKPGENA